MVECLVSTRRLRPNVVGVGLLAIAVCLIKNLYQAVRNREQAHSYKGR